MTLIFGHRGASGDAPENTLKAFKMAADAQADGVELDVQLTKDGVLVVCHDESIDRTSDGKGLIRDLTYEELLKYNFNNHFEGEVCRIPTLEEVFQLLKPYGLMINIELKTGIYPYPGIEDKVLELVHRYQMEEKIIYSSFNHYSIKRILEKEPKAYCGLLDEDWIVNYGAYARSLGCKAVHPMGYLLQDETMLNDIKDHGLDINTWTINENEEIMFCLMNELHCLITNYPAKALDLRWAYETAKKVVEGKGALEIYL